MIKLGIKRRTRVESLKTTQPPKLDLTITPNLAYILGVCYGDGSICSYFDRKWGNHRHIISLEVLEKELALSFKKALENVGFKPSFSFYYPKNVYRVRQYSNEFYNWFKVLSLDNLKELLKDDSCATEFIRGFYESEGCLSRLRDKKYPNYVGYQLSMANTNFGILLLVKEYLEKLGLSFGVGKLQDRPRSTKTAYRIYTSDKKKIARFLKIIRPIIKNKFQSPSRESPTQIQGGEAK